MRWLMSRSGWSRPWLIHSITRGNIAQFRREACSDSSLRVSSCWGIADGSAEKPSTPLRAAGDAMRTASSRIRGWHTASKINVGPASSPSRRSASGNGSRAVLIVSSAPQARARSSRSSMRSVTRTRTPYTPFKTWSTMRPIGPAP